MVIDKEQIMKAFKIYSVLISSGKCSLEENRFYLADDEIRHLVDEFAREQDCTVIAAGDMLYLIPDVKNSIYHVSNEKIKKEYLPARADNGDLYLMYASIIVLIGEFYDSDNTLEAVKDFIRIEEWLEKLNERLEALKSIGIEKLKEYEMEFQYNWTGILEKWDAINDINEKVKVQDNRTISRLSFLNTVKRFLVDMELIKEIAEELYLTEKTKVVVQKYFMEEEHNRDILEFIYSFKRND